MRDTLLLHLRSDLKVGEQTFLAGSLLHADAAGYLRGERKLRPLFTPTATRSLAGYTTTRDHVIVNVLDNVASKLEQWLKRGGEFSFSEIKAPFPGTLGVSSLHDELIKDDALANRYLLTYTDFLTPDSLFLATAGSEPNRWRKRTACPLLSTSLESLISSSSLFDTEPRRNSPAWALTQLRAAVAAELPAILPER